jgi:hypothetical protein
VTLPQVLIATVRRFLGTSTEEPHLEVDWPSLLSLAEAHGVTPILYLTVGRDELRNRFEGYVLRSLAQSAEIVRLAQIFDQNGIAFIALKGPMLSQYLYGSVGIRASGDIDVLVESKDMPRIRRVLVSSGYRMITSLHWDSDSACLRSREDETILGSPSAVNVDVHWRLIPRYSASVFDNLTGWESLRSVPLAGREIRTLAPEPLLLLLCAHGAKHMFEQLSWICDIARFLQVTPNLDWARLIDQSRRTASLRQLSLGVHLAAELLGAPVAPLPKGREVEALIKAVINRLMSGAIPPVPTMEYYLYTLRLLEKTNHRARFLAGQYLTPSEAEYRALRLPPPLYFLYYPFRPLRLLWKHSFGQL